MSVRVRFAPSPTGFLHIGNARAAIINYLFALQQKGEFILRLDDTDRERSENRFIEAIFDNLSWLGITPNQTFQQSHRFPKYQAALDGLRISGRLYPCYESPEELDFQRKRQIAKGEPPRYDRSALALSETEKRSYEAEGRKPYWRFQLTPGVIHWHDLIRGDVTFHADVLSDPVLVRADGAFLYTLTSVVDDIDTGITHIFRGEDHVTNTAIQIQLFKALQTTSFALPLFGHTTLLLDEDGHPLSKRLGSLSLNALRDKEIEPMTLASLLGSLGTSRTVEACPDWMSLAQTFSIESFSRTPPRFSFHDLENLNAKVLPLLSLDAVRGRLKDHPSACLSKDDFSRFWETIGHNIRVFSDIDHWYQVCYGELQNQKTSTSLLDKAACFLPPEPWDETTWGIWTSAIALHKGCKPKDLFKHLRQHLTGDQHGPEMKKLLPLIGMERTQRRLISTTQC